MSTNKAPDLEAALGVIAGELGGDNAGSGCRRMDKAVTSNVDTNMSDVAAAGIEAEEITRLQIGDFHMLTVESLLFGSSFVADDIK